MSSRRFRPYRPTLLDTHVVGNGVHHPGKAEGCERCRKCSVCTKIFRGHEPLIDGNGNQFHAKCAPKPDMVAMIRSVARFFGSHGVKAVEFVDGNGKRYGGFKTPKRFVTKMKRAKFISICDPGHRTKGRSKK